MKTVKIQIWRNHPGSWKAESERVTINAHPTSNSGLFLHREGRNYGYKIWEKMSGLFILDKLPTLAIARDWAERCNEAEGDWGKPLEELRKNEAVLALLREHRQTFNQRV